MKMQVIHIELKQHQLVILLLMVKINNLHQMHLMQNIYKIDLQLVEIMLMIH